MYLPLPARADIATTTTPAQHIPRDPRRAIQSIHLRHVAQLRPRQRDGHLRAHAGRIPLRAPPARAAAHHGRRRARDERLLLRVRGARSSQHVGGAERGVLVRGGVLPQRLLRHAVRVHARGAAERAPRDGQRRGGRVQPRHGRAERRGGDGGRHEHARAAVRVRGAVCGHGGGERCVSV